MGVSCEEFKHLNPRKLSYIRKGYIKKIKQIDCLNWINGQYTAKAVAIAIEQNFAKHPIGKYAEKPYLCVHEECFFDTEKNKKYIESQEEVAVFEMKQRIKVLEKQGLPQSPI